MSSGVTLTAATRQNLLSLQDTANLLSSTQNRLSTGKKVNSALDDPTSFFTSQALTGRSGDISSLLNGISNGVQTIQAANQGITSIQKLVDSAKSTANQALADKSALSSGTAASAAALGGSKSYAGLAGTADGTQDFSSLAKDGSLEISLDGGTTKTTIRLDALTLGGSVNDLTKVTADQVSSAINSQIASSSALKGKVTSSVSSDGRINFATTSAGSNQKLSVAGSVNANLDIGFGKPATAPTALTRTAGAAAALTAYSATSGSYLTVGDGVTSTNIALDTTTLKADGTTFGTAAPTADDLVFAINAQLKASGSTLTAANSTGSIQFTSQDLGTSAAITVAVKAPPSGTQVDIGLGATTGAATGAYAGGAAGSAVTGLSALGADATDGSSKATVVGSAAPPTTTDYVTTSKDSSFDIKLGDNQAKKIILNQSTLDSSATASEIVAAINKQFSADTGLSGKVEASLDNTGKIQINTTSIGANQKISVQASQTLTGAAEVNIGFGLKSASSAAIADTGTDSTGSSNSTRQSLAKQFNELLNQITQQAKDSSYNGINLLYRSGTNANENSLKVAFNETGSSSLTIAGTKLDADGLGLTSITGGFQTDDEINKTLTAITTATSQLRAQSSTFGSSLSVVQNRQDFSKNLINILDNGAANLTNADLNEEAANSQALSTRNSIATSALSLANQAQQGILQLLR